ncbi:F0F1 ATP synthase subunit A [Parasediminibacterium sp. JCM 36343]|uniref:F0F1 ATP synthase subunit A n=1 Tax=Parasediminibacterium sp. JCM 36343 TaxID=3374279 RepID=UPI003979468E
MLNKISKSLLLVAFSLLMVFFSAVSYAQEKQGNEPVEAKKEAAKFDPAKLIMEHIMDAHEFHFFSVGDFHAKIPLPVIVYNQAKGVSVFSYAKLEEGAVYDGYKSEEGKIVAVDADGKIDETAKVIDISLTRNVVQMILSLTLLVVLMIGIANKYKKNGSMVAPSGWQNAIEPVITFVRDEVGKPNLGHKYEKYMPYLLTVFFFILINNIVGLIPGTANVTGNIAFTMVLAVISFVVIMLSTNSHFWGHIFWPPGMPIFVKVILIPVELLSVLLIKPASLMIRLFANMVAGHIIITCFIMLIFIFGAMSPVAGWGFSPVSIAFTVFIYFIEILVAFLQAFIFTTLTALFIGQSFEGEHGEHELNGEEVHI